MIMEKARRASNRIVLKNGENQRPNGRRYYSLQNKFGKEHCVYARH